jgi:hypothetical protein
MVPPYGVCSGRTLRAVDDTDAYCDHCGGPLGMGGHDDCRVARLLEPPRYCAKCRRRLVVQVTPHGWSARCSRHGATDPAAR